MALIQVSAYAKINLFLAVGDLRPDGFHDILTVMRRTSLCDEVEVETVADGRGKITLTATGDEKIPTDSDNIAYRAAEKYLSFAGITDSVSISIEKNIPIGAGLGGGSADAAATLRALERIYGALSKEKILDIALSLGSDVPFCIFGWTAICEGRGEVITPITDKQTMHLVIAMNGQKVLASEAYRLLDNARGESSGDIDKAGEYLPELLKYLSNEGEMPTMLYNSFEFALGEAEDKVLYLKQKMKECGASLTLMSGSGPSVFGIFPDRDSAEYCVEALRGEGIRAYYSK
jgi:4-diphosphocytidyl-2-C-methyl-D-erythritol kinase